MVARVGVTPYVVTVAPKVCTCRLPAMELGTRKRLDVAIALVEGYWAVYLAFFGGQQIWLDWLVTDQRDGRIMWRNGRQLHKEDDSGTTLTG
jgi:hypothetical protein